jgi:prefoldin subunit 5
MSWWRHLPEVGTWSIHLDDRIAETRRAIECLKNRIAELEEEIKEAEAKGDRLAHKYHSSDEIAEAKEAFNEKVKSNGH